MKHIFATMLVTLLLSAPALASYTFVVPQEPGGGTAVWAQLIAKELEPFLGEKINIRTIPGARDIPGFNRFHNELQFDDKTVMISHGGNAVSFLQENVDYNYAEYESIGMQNLNIIAGKRVGADTTRPVFASGSGMVPEAFAMTMLICGPGLTVDEYIACFRENVTWVNGMSGSERRLAFRRGELNSTRENPVAFVQHVMQNADAKIWFHHGLLDLNTGDRTDDPNFAGYQFEELFEQKWGVAPSGEFYDAYNLVRSFRDVLQKALWVRAGNPNRDRLVAALTAMVNDEDAMARIIKSGGDYEWIIGSDGDTVRDMLMTYITKSSLENLIKFNRDALGLNSIYKDSLVE